MPAAGLAILLLSSCSDDDEFVRCETARASIDFGTVTTLPDGVLSRAFIEPLVVRNTGTRDLEVDIEFDTPGTAGAPQFTFPAGHAIDHFVIAPGDSDSVHVAVVLQPSTVAGDFTGSIDLGSPCGPIPLTVSVVPD